MISPEVLRRFPFFGNLTEAQLRSIAMITEGDAVDEDALLLCENQPADALYLLVDGGLDLYFTVDEKSRHPAKIFSVGEINPGEPFGLSALVEPYIYTTTVRATLNSRVLKIDAVQLRQLCEKDINLSHQLMIQIAKAAMQRLTATRVQLAAAWA